MNKLHSAWLYSMGWNGKRGYPVPGTGRWWFNNKRRGHGENAEAGGRIGHRWWSKRAVIAGISGWSIFDKDAKVITHRAERRMAKRELYKMLDELSD